MTDRQRTHYFGDDCPGGHIDASIHVTTDGIYAYCAGGDWNSGPYRTAAEARSAFDVHADVHREAAR